jgi:hypothetical protein
MEFAAKPEALNIERARPEADSCLRGFLNCRLYLASTHATAIYTKRRLEGEKILKRDPYLGIQCRSTPEPPRCRESASHARYTPHSARNSLTFPKC